LSKGDVPLLKLFRQTVPQRRAGSGKTAVTELVAWSLDHPCSRFDNLQTYISIVEFKQQLKTFLFVSSQTTKHCEVLVYLYLRNTVTYWLTTLAQNNTVELCCWQWWHWSSLCSYFSTDMYIRLTNVRWLPPLAAVLCGLLTIECAWSRGHATSSVTAVLPPPGQRCGTIWLNSFGNQTSPSNNSNNCWKCLCLV